MKKYFLAAALGAAVIAVWLFAGAGSANPEAAGNVVGNFSPTPSSAPVSASSVSRVEVIHFHGNNQCNSCIAVGAYAEETVNTYFTRELSEGRISFAHVNAELPENRELAVKYGVTSSSLWIGVYDANGFHKEENTLVWYKINDKAEYMGYLKGILEKRLRGDLG